MYFPTPYAVGLDLGQSHDYSALAVVEHVDRLPADWPLARYQTRLDTRPGYPCVLLPKLTRELRVVHLQRWALGTPYHEVVADVAELVSRPELDGARFLFDRSGVGRPVGDLLWQAFENGLMGNTMPEGRTITGAERSTGRSVAKRDLIAALEIPVQQRRFFIPRALPLRDVLERELASFKLKLAPKTGKESYDVKRDGEGHGDLVIAVALAAVQPEYGIHPSVEESPEAAYPRR